jgi:two-component system, LytTR family, sensor histidine kinase AlgZ
MQNDKNDVQELIPDLCQVQAILWLILFSEALVVVLLLLVTPDFDFSWQRFAMMSFYVQWVVLVTSACLCRVRLHVRQLSLQGLLGLSFALILLVNGLVSLATLWMINTSFEAAYDWVWLLRNEVIAAIVAGVLLNFFYAQMQWRLQARSEMQARVQALQSRIRPHFLFNSMNIIASLIHDAPDKAEQAVEDLSELFRASLKEAGVQVPMAQEIALCEKYLNIESLRLGSRLRVTWQRETMPDEAPIPLLTLQPLLENAIYHGIAPAAQGGVVNIQLAYDKGLIKILVSNSIATEPKSERHEKGNQMALENIRYRLQALFGENVSMQQFSDGQLFTMCIEYPWERA